MPLPDEPGLLVLLPELVEPESLPPVEPGVFMLDAPEPESEDPELVEPEREEPVSDEPELDEPERDEPEPLELFMFISVDEPDPELPELFMSDVPELLEPLEPLDLSELPELLDPLCLRWCLPFLCCMLFMSLCVPLPLESGLACDLVVALPSPGVAAVLSPWLVAPAMAAGT
ncbi:membrane protein [Novimethylophilus kurashikiensis]|uniref:Membrane protein n=1 Tax=Novimethylophilus kurashikiensis TaxID=1825523 RepID=A0A2R5F151_9PROT|nr:membrane protein [Novimethylophilus kurashikiensis]